MNAVAEPIIKDAAYWTDYALETWARSMRGLDLPDGVPSKACSGLLQNYSTLDTDNDRAYGQLDEWIAQNTGAVVDSLPTTQKSVIWHAYGLIDHIEVWRYDTELKLAKLAVQEGLRRRGVWLGA